MLTLERGKALSFSLKNIIDGTECRNTTVLRLGKDKEYLLVEFHCTHEGKYETPYARYNDPVYRGEVVELFIGVEGKEIYYEFDLAPNNALFNARIFFHEKHGAFVKVIDEKIVSHSVEEKEKEYVATMKIPLETFERRSGEFIFNAYRIVSNGADKEYQALNPTGKLDFHRRDKFIELKIKDEK